MERSEFQVGKPGRNGILGMICVADQICSCPMFVEVFPGFPWVSFIPFGIPLLKNCGQRIDEMLDFGSFKPYAMLADFIISTLRQYCFQVGATWLETCFAIAGTESRTWYSSHEKIPTWCLYCITSKPGDHWKELSAEVTYAQTYRILKNLQAPLWAWEYTFWHCGQCGQYHDQNKPGLNTFWTLHNFHRDFLLKQQAVGGPAGSVLLRMSRAPSVLNTGGCQAWRWFACEKNDGVIGLSRYSNNKLMDIVTISWLFMAFPHDSITIL